MTMNKASRAKRHRAGPASLADRLRRRLELDVATGCINWTGPTMNRGYGRLGIGGRGSGHILAHRLAYEIANGPIPDGLVIDHVCRNTRCCNPAHLEAVENAENLRRGDGPNFVNARKTHCAHGHEFTPENTRLRKDGGRACRTCHRLRMAAHSGQAALGKTQK